MELCQFIFLTVSQFLLPLRVSENWWENTFALPFSYFMKSLSLLSILVLLPFVFHLKRSNSFEVLLFFPIRFILLMEKFLDSKYTKAEFDFDVQIFWIWLTFWNGNGKGQAITSFLWILTEFPCLPSSFQYGGDRRTTSCSNVSQSSDSMMRISPTNNLRQRYRTLCWNTTGYLCVKQMPSTTFFI